MKKKIFFAIALIAVLMNFSSCFVGYYEPYHYHHYGWYGAHPYYHPHYHHHYGSYGHYSGSHGW